MLRWMFGHMRKNMIKNENIQGKVVATAIEDKMRENWLRWFGYMNRGPTKATIRICDYKKKVQGKNG